METDIWQVRKARRQEFIRSAHDIAYELTLLDGIAWAVEPDKEPHSNSNPVLVSIQNDERIWMHYDEYKHTMSLNGSYGRMPDGRMWLPRDYLHDAVDPHPTMSAAKSPEVIAKDIMRRFLPEYRAHLAAYHAQRDERAKAHQEMKELAAELIGLSAGHLQRPHQVMETDTSMQLHLYDAPIGVSYGDFDVNSTYVAIKLSVTPDCARKLAKLIGSNTI